KKVTLQYYRDSRDVKARVLEMMHMLHHTLIFSRLNRSSYSQHVSLDLEGPGICIWQPMERTMISMNGR
uniref:Uncharacterized protein n=1 Tax=Oryza brachyantha TaxID=4533 RepID=J3M9Q6_ORYBR